jgi:hypothetical protein
MTGEWHRAVGKSRDTRLTPRAEYFGFCFFYWCLNHKQGPVFSRKTFAQQASADSFTAFPASIAIVLKREETHV